MARAVISKVAKQKLVRVSAKRVKNSVILNTKPGTAQFQNIVPFRIRFTTIGVESFGPNSAAPIGIAIIGLSNYVM